MLRVLLLRMRSSTQRNDSTPPIERARSALRGPTMRRLIYPFVLLALLAAGPASAALIRSGDSTYTWTTDTSTGLDWLSFQVDPFGGTGLAPSTVGRSYHDVASEMGVGGDYQGWRYASQAEVFNFIFNISGQRYLGDGVDHDYGDLALAISSYTGFTSEAIPVSVGIIALVADVPAPSFHTQMLIFFNPNREPFGVWDADARVNDFTVAPDTGSWLVRATTSSVPLPSSLWLTATLIGVIGVARRRRLLSTRSDA